MSRLIFGLLFLYSLPIFPQQPKGASTTGTKKPTPNVAAAVEQRGEFVFAHYCIRCHTPPEGFSPRISQTVAMHMRVRANLGNDDYQALVHFLNP